jgi:hypothetical protein
MHTETPFPLALRYVRATRALHCSGWPVLPTLGRTYDEYMVTIASGMVLGEGITSIATAFMKSRGLG